MIGCVITGHGDFSTGLYHATTMIAGQQNFFEVIPFREELPLEEFEDQLKNAIDKMYKETDGVIIFTDLLGGTPFRVAMLATQEFENTAVMTGTNLPVLIEGSIMRAGETDAKSLAAALVETGKSGLQLVVLPSVKDDSINSEEEEGI